MDFFFAYVQLPGNILHKYFTSLSTFKNMRQFDSFRRQSYEKVIKNTPKQQRPLSVSVSAVSVFAVTHNVLRK